MGAQPRDVWGPQEAMWPKGGVEPSRWPSQAPGQGSHPSAATPGQDRVPGLQKECLPGTFLSCFVMLKNPHLFCVEWSGSKEALITKVTCSLEKGWKIQKSTKRKVKPHRSPHRALNN